MTFRILFVYPNIGTNISFSPAIQILSAVLKREGYQTSLLHLHEKHGIPDDKEKIMSFIKKERPDLIGFTATSFEYDLANRIAGNIKENVDVPIILGGVHATIQPSDLETSNFDAFCIGEGEWNLLSLVQKMEKGADYTDTPSFYFKTRNGIRKNALRPMVENLDELPFYDMEIMDIKKILLLRNKWLSIGFSRGCPYDCSFCINPLLRKIKVGSGDVKKYLRKRSVENVIAEFESILNKYKGCIDVFNFDDDLLMLDKPWMLHFVREYKERIYDKYGIKYAINARVNTMQDELISRMAESGCQEIRIGFETGDPVLRRDILNKPITDEQLINAFSVCHKYKIRASAFAMLGIPGESRESIRKTLNLLAKLKPYLIRMTFLFPYYHTEIYNYCEKNSLLKKDWMHVDEFTVSPLKFEKLSDDVILKYKHMFPWYLNAIMLSPEKAVRYQKLIDSFAGMSFDEFKNAKDGILKKDESISSEMQNQGVSHYRYFRNNLYYYQLLSPEIKQGGEEDEC